MEILSKTLFVDESRERKGMVGSKIFPNLSVTIQLIKSTAAPIVHSTDILSRVDYYFQKSERCLTTYEIKP
jgi:hypothetical protein